MLLTTENDASGVPALVEPSGKQLAESFDRSLGDTSVDLENFGGWNPDYLNKLEDIWCYHNLKKFEEERKILEDATAEADQIIAGARHVSQSAKDEVSRALQLMVVDIQKEAMDTAKNFTSNYQLTLKQLSAQSTTDFQEIVKGLKNDLQIQIQQFHQNLLPVLEKQLEDYRTARLAQTEKMVTSIVQKAAPEILNRSLSLEDHRSLVLESLEKAKKAGAFD